MTACDNTYQEIKYTVSNDVANNFPNEACFYVSNVQKRKDSPLENKVIYWLGSSVTYGAASNGQSMADYLQALTGCVSKKDAVSGTTIFCDNKTDNTGVKSYVYRLENSQVFNKNEKIDAFICQISTNDTCNDRLNNRGVITGSDVYSLANFDKSTTLGGIEYVITYVKETWNCPIYFYSGAYFGNDGERSSVNPKGSEYAKLVSEVKSIIDKYNKIDGFNVDIIDLYNDKNFNNVASSNYYIWAMKDAVHPYSAGYLQWWTPYFEAFLIDKIGK